MPERALLIWNPVAGRRPERRRGQIEQLALGLRQGGWQVDAAETVAMGGARPAAERGRREGCTLLVACGGDGTLNQVAQALAEGGPGGPKLAVVPWGTANVFAQTFRCPAGPRAAAQWLLRAQARAVPVGRVVRAAGTQYFIAVASVGVDAEAVRQIQDRHKRRWGKLAYAAAAIAAWRRYFPAPIDFQIDGHPGVADGIVVGLTRFYGGRMRLGRVAPGGGIALALRGAPRMVPWQALWLATLGLERAPGVERLAQGPDPIRIAITSSGLPLELDGEAAGLTPAVIEVARQGLTVLAAPRG